MKSTTPSWSWDIFFPSLVAVSVFVTEGDLDSHPGSASSRTWAARGLSCASINGGNDSIFTGQL